jgi:2-keto-4-pentenoate hydratase/2-oxohepta-3-ene-1,7-dioic acid hydratase in catechol pathway
VRLLTFMSESGLPHVGALRDDKIVDISAWLGRQSRFDLASASGMLYLISAGQKGLDLARAALEAGDDELISTGALLPVDTAGLLAPIPRPTKNVFCLGRNYQEHAAESARAFGEAPPVAPDFPTFFTKAPTAVTGPYDSIPYDASVSEMIDWECELALVIGRTGKNIRRDEALTYVFGYTVLNDISARDIQSRHGGQYFKGKSLDGACPMGPWIVTADEIGDPGDLQLWTRVNGVEKQHASTREMIFDVAATIESLSLGMTLEPGDIVATGTPAGIGHARTPPEYLRPGDVVECEVEKIGVIRNQVQGADQ